MKGVLVAILSGLLSAGCSVFGIRTEPMPAYSVERTLETAGQTIEIRRYGPRLAAEATVPGDEMAARSRGFRTLAGYIFGGNTSKTSIEMTAPVAQSKSETISMTAPVVQSRGDDGAWRIRFIMPATYSLETLPRPNDPAVAIVTLPPETVAVLRYSGSTSPAAVHDAEARLLAAVRQNGLTPAGTPFSWFYDPPWTLPPLRRNEAVVTLQPG